MFVSYLLFYGGTMAVIIKKQRNAFLILIGIAVGFQAAVTPLLIGNPQTWTNWGSLILFGILGYLGLRFFQEKAGFPGMLNSSISHLKRFGLSAVWGVIFAAGAILFDLFSQNQVPQIPFPLSLFAYIPIAVIDNMFWRLFLLPFLIWLISYRILKTEITVHAFRVITLLETLLYFFIQLNLYKAMVGPLSGYSVLQILLVSGGFMLTACILYRRYGFLAPVSMQMVQYIIYHGLYGGISG